MTNGSPTIAIRAGWAAFVTRRRKELHLSQAALSINVGVHHSYISLIELDGLIPSREKVIRMALALDTGVDETLLLAGYAPITKTGFRRAMASLKGRV